MGRRSSAELGSRTALVTGATGGLGGHIARALASAGADLVLSGRDAGRLEGVAASLRQPGTRIETAVADLADPGGPAQLAAALENLGSDVDVVVNNAGIELVASFEGVEGSEVDQLLAVNLRAPMELTRLLVGEMLLRGSGHFVNVASLAGRIPPAHAAAYAATKAGLIAFTHSLRAEFRGRPVGFSAICPGFVAGDGMYARLVAEGLEAPGRVGTVEPRKVADAVVEALRRDRPEIVVGGRPVGAVIAAAAAAPRLGERATAASGLHAYFGRIAAHQQGNAPGWPPGASRRAG